MSNGEMRRVGIVEFLSSRSRRREAFERLYREQLSSHVEMNRPPECSFVLRLGRLRATRNKLRLATIREVMEDHNYRLAEETRGHAHDFLSRIAITDEPSGVGDFMALLVRYEATQQSAKT